MNRFGIMPLIEILEALAVDLKVNAADLIGYAESDDIGGWDEGKGEWPNGSIFGSEGQILHAVVRALKPDTVMELGALWGCSSKHILSALTANRKGKLITVGAAADYTGVMTGAQNKRWLNVPDDVRTTHLPAEAQIVVIDHDHTTEGTAYLVARAMKLKPQVLFVHNALHPVIGEDVTAGVVRVTEVVSRYCPPDASCGWAVWTRGMD